MTATPADRLGAIAAQWDGHGDHPMFDRARLQYGRLIFSGLQRFYADCFARLPRGLANALDLGCGSGDNLVHLLRTGVIQRATGVEISQGALRNAEALREHFAIDPARLQLVASPVEDARFDERFSLILATQLIGYLSDPDAMLRVAARQAAPGAYLFISDRQRLSLTPVDALKNNDRLRRVAGKRPLAEFGGDLHVHPYQAVAGRAAAFGFVPVWTRYALHPIAGLAHGFAHALNGRRYSTAAARRAASALFTALTWARRAEDAALAGVPTGYLYAALFRFEAR